MEVAHVPRWFLVIALSALVTIVPWLLVQERRMTIVETHLETMDKARRDDQERVVLLLDRLDGSVGKLAESVASLNTEVKYIKEK